MAVLSEAVPLPPLPLVHWSAITDIRIEPVHHPLRAPFRTALRAVTELRGWQVTLQAGSGGLQGVGTTVATPQITGDTDESILAALRGPLTDAISGQVELEQALRAVAAVPGNSSARAAMDIALHSLAARQLAPTGLDGDGLVELFGGRRCPIRSDITISLNPPEQMARDAKSRMAEGFRVLKLKLGGAGERSRADNSEDFDRVRAVAQRIDPEHTVLRLDANQAWSAVSAIRLLTRLHDAGIAIELVEQPCEAADLMGMAFVTRRSPFPVLADESAFTAVDVRRIADAHAADLINLKLQKCGGLFPAREMILTCAETNLGLVVGCMLEPSAGVSAATDLATACVRGDTAHDLDAAWWVGASP